MNQHYYDKMFDCVIDFIPNFYNTVYFNTFYFRMFYFYLLLKWDFVI